MLRLTLIPRSSSKTDISFEDRLYIIQTINALPSQQFEELIFALNPPKGILPPRSAPQGDRSKDLLDWVEGPTGPGLRKVDKALHKIVSATSNISLKFTAFAISGQLGDLSPRELEAIVQLLRKKTGDDSIDLAFFGEGSIKLVLSGTLKGLESLQELFTSGELVETLKNRSTEYVRSIDMDTTEARKANLIQALRIREIHTSKLTLSLSFVLTEVIVQALDRVFTMTQNITLKRALKRALIDAHSLRNKLVHDLWYVDLKIIIQDLNRHLRFSLNLSRKLELDRARNITHITSLAYDINRLLDLALSNDFSKIHGINNDINRELGNIKSLDLDLNLNFNSALMLAYKMSYTYVDLSGIDLSGANLQGLNLIGVPLIGTNLNNAIVKDCIFGENPGLTESDKEDLKSRGAIFHSFLSLG